MNSLADPRPGDVWIPQSPAHRRTIVERISNPARNGVRFIEDGVARTRTLRRFRGWVARHGAQPMPDPLAGILCAARD